MTISFYNISVPRPYDTIRYYIVPNSYFTGRWNTVYVEGSNDTTNGSNGTWTNIGWADGSNTKHLSGPQGEWVEASFNRVDPYKAYRFRSTSIEQYITVNEIELISSVQANDPFISGVDTSGNGNNWTVNGTITQTTDTPTNNYATLNPNDTSGTV